MNSHTRPPFFVVSLFILVALSAGANAHAETSADDCEGSSVEKFECVATQLAVANKELGTVYQTARAQLKLDSQSKDPLTRQSAVEIDRRTANSQKAWLAFREADCDFQGAEMLRGAGEELYIRGCLLEKTRERIKQLREFPF